jgi:hypothetical protein
MVRKRTRHRRRRGRRRGRRCRRGGGNLGGLEGFQARQHCARRRVVIVGRAVTHGGAAHRARQRAFLLLRGPLLSRGARLPLSLSRYLLKLLPQQQLGRGVCSTTVLLLLLLLLSCCCACWRVLLLLTWLLLLRRWQESRCANVLLELLGHCAALVAGRVEEADGHGNELRRLAHDARDAQLLASWANRHGGAALQRAVP